MVRTNAKAFLSLVLVFCTVASDASTQGDGCSSDVLVVVGRHFALKEFSPVDKGGRVVAGACKEWPAAPHLLLSVFAYDASVESEKTLLVSVLDQRRKRIVSSYADRIFEDAVTEVGTGSLSLDTAGYQLAPTVRALGVRFRSAARGPSCADKWSWNELTLFVQDRAALLPIFREYLLYQRALHGCIGSATGRDVWELGSRSISVMNTRTKGFFDLLLLDTVRVDTNMDVMPSNVDPRKRVSTKLLKFNGERYE